MKTETFGTSKEVLYDAEYKAVPVTIDSESVTAEDGKRVLEAGTLVRGDGASIFDDRGVKVVAGTTADTNLDGVLLYDVDVTDGDAAGACVYAGTLWANKVNGGNVPAEVRDQLNQIKFITE